MVLHHASQVDRADDIDIVQNEGLIQRAGVLQKEMSRLFQSAASVEQDLLTRDFNAHAEVVVRFQVIKDHVGKMMHIDDDLANAKFAQAGKRDLEQHPAA